MGTVPASPPPVYTVVANALASVRAQTWTSAQVTALDAVIAMLADDFEQIHPRFNKERFMTLAHFRQGVRQ